MATTILKLADGQPAKLISVPPRFTRCPRPILSAFIHLNLLRAFVLAAIQLRTYTRLDDVCLFELGDSA